MRPPGVGTDPVPINDAIALNQSGQVAHHPERGPPVFGGMRAQIDHLVFQRKRSDPTSLKVDPHRSRPKRIFIGKEANTSGADLPMDVDIGSAAPGLQAWLERPEPLPLSGPAPVAVSCVPPGYPHL